MKLAAGSKAATADIVSGLQWHDEGAARSAREAGKYSSQAIEAGECLFEQGLILSVKAYGQGGGHVGLVHLDLILCVPTTSMILMLVF